jgi:hypothetical protein
VVYDWWLTPVVYAGVSIVLLEARSQRAILQGKKRIFRGSSLVKLLYSGAAGVISVLLFANGAESEWWLNLLAVALVIGFLVGWPKTIVTDERGIECFWWWRRKVFIPWDQVEYAEKGKAGAIEVVGAHARITFLGYNVDPTRFCQEVTARSNVKKIVIPSEFTGLHL